MFFIGQFNGSPVPATLQADIIGLVTGTITDAAQLASAFVAGNSRLVSTIAPGWELADAAAGTVVNGVTPKVIRSPWSDDPTKFKNMLIDSRTSGQLAFLCYEAWNATTHVGTNPMGGISVASSDWHNMPMQTSGWLVVSATPTHLLVMMLNNGTPMAALPYFQWVSEFSREDPWNTVANGYPSWFHNGSWNSQVSPVDKSNIGMPRFPSAAGASAADQTGVRAQSSISLPTGNLFKIVPQTFYFSGDGNGVGLEVIGRHSASGPYAGITDTLQKGALLSPLRLMPWYGPVNYGALVGGSITEKNDMVYAFRGGWTPGDEFDFNGERYMVFNLASANDTIAVKVG